MVSIEVWKREDTPDAEAAETAAVSREAGAVPQCEWSRQLSIGTAFVHRPAAIQVAVPAESALWRRLSRSAKKAGAFDAATHGVSPVLGLRPGLRTGVEPVTDE
jgi:hypothetical protein